MSSILFRLFSFSVPIPEWFQISVSFSFCLIYVLILSLYDDIIILSRILVLILNPILVFVSFPFF